MLLLQEKACLEVGSYLQQTGLEHLEDGVHRIGDAGLAAVAPLVNRVVLGLALRTGDATRIGLLCERHNIQSREPIP